MSSLSFVAGIVIGIAMTSSFIYWKNKGGIKMVLKNDVVDDGERPKRGILGRTKKIPVPPEPQYVEYPPEPEESEEPEVPAPPKQDTEVTQTMQNIISDLNKLSEHMKTMAEAMTYLHGYLKGKNVI